MSDMEWQAKGACVGYPFPDIWFSPVRADVAEAKRVCKRECWVQTECAEYALANDVHGVWAGLTVEERGQIKARRAA